MMRRGRLPTTAPGGERVQEARREEGREVRAAQRLTGDLVSGE
jgi:hypothetical protein